MSPYRGRFAPSPSGPLHFGSLFIAVLSYVHAKYHNGQWLIRIEDIDPPRQMPQAENQILECLAAHGLHSDEDIYWQSEQLPDYQHMLAQLHARQLAYPCCCSRKRLQHLDYCYDGHCWQQPPNNSPDKLSWRLRNTHAVRAFVDGQLGRQDLGSTSEYAQDIILRRRDGLFAYNLAVVHDDIAQGITHVVRGNDLLSTTFAQIALYHMLDAPVPEFTHYPLLVSEPGHKLSKQNHAPAVNNLTPEANVREIFRLLDHPPPANLGTCEAIYQWAIAHWPMIQPNQQREIIV